MSSNSILRGIVISLSVILRVERRFPLRCFVLTFLLKPWLSIKNILSWTLLYRDGSFGAYSLFLRFLFECACAKGLSVSWGQVGFGSCKRWSYKISEVGWSSLPFNPVMTILWIKSTGLTASIFILCTSTLIFDRIFSLMENQIEEHSCYFFFKSGLPDRFLGQ